MPEQEVAAVFRECCGASHWVDGMTDRRPFRSREAVFRAADQEWDECGESDWLEAFSHHPRIGDRSVRGTASDEQSGARGANEEIQAELERTNKAYEDKFGHIYIVCATGKTAEEMLDIARRRMQNDPATELRVAAEEQRRIMHLRPEKLLGAET